MKIFPALLSLCVIFLASSGEAIENHENLHHQSDHHKQNDFHQHSHHQGNDQRQTPVAQNTETSGYSTTIWIQALLTTAFLGAAPVFILYFVPLGYGDMEKQKPTLRVFLSFAAGGLLGDSFLHLLPHALGPVYGHNHHQHNHGAAHAHSVAELAPWLWTLAGMMTFLGIEKFVRIHSTTGHKHSHGNSPVKKAKTSDDEQEVPTKGADIRRRTLVKKESQLKEDFISKKEQSTISASGYLNLVADFSHNFTDGLALGATFQKGRGWQTAIAIFLHEIPHEIGDFAILIQSGFSRKRAMIAQFFTAIGAMIGTVIGLVLQHGDESSWALPFTAGGFIYIALCTVFPELLETSSALQSVKEIIAMCVGIGMMVLITLLE